MNLHFRTLIVSVEKGGKMTELTSRLKASKDIVVQVEQLSPEVIKALLIDMKYGTIIHQTLGKTLIEALIRLDYEVRFCPM